MDRKVNLRVVDGSKSSSLSARRAWIEKFDVLDVSAVLQVALRKESVDRKFCAKLLSQSMRGRSPQGERG